MKRRFHKEFKSGWLLLLGGLFLLPTSTGGFPRVFERAVDIAVGSPLPIQLMLSYFGVMTAGTQSVPKGSMTGFPVLISCLLNDRRERVCDRFYR